MKKLIPLIVAIMLFAGCSTGAFALINGVIAATSSLMAEDDSED